MNEALDRINSYAGPCGIACGSCPQGSMWSPFVPGGEVIDWTAVNRGLDWIEK